MADGMDSPVTSIPDAILNIVSRLGGVEAALKQSPTHEKLSQLFTDTRKDFGDRLNSSEQHTRALIEKLDADSARRGSEKHTELQTWLTTAAKSAAKEAAKEALAEQKAFEAAARAEMQQNDADVDRRIRNANRNGLGGILIGLLSVGYAVGKSQGIFQ